MFASETVIMHQKDSQFYKIDQSFWFDQRIKELAQKPYCVECKARIPDQFYRHAVAHIFPKNIFHSVATHRWNYIFLGAGCGCHDKTHTILSFSKMKCFPLAIVRFRQFQKEIIERHKYLDLFLTESAKISPEL